MAIQLTQEQAKLTILGHAVMGHRGAQELLGIIFQDNPKQDEKKKSA